MEKVPEILKRLEKEHDIKIIYAIEAGSRAWGMESHDSDYDIRFIFVYNDTKRYVSLTPLKETFDGFSEDRLYDWQGWDITKSLRLIGLMNPSITEWLYSPMIYMRADLPNGLDFAATARTLLKEQNRVSPLMYHYRSMVKTNYKDHIEKRERVKVKKYLYVIRPAGMFEWLSKCNEGKALADNFDIDYNKILIELKAHLEPACYAEILSVIERKKGLAELDEVPRIECIDKWIESVLNDRNDELVNIKSEESNHKKQIMDDYDNFLHHILNIKF
jgi:predicted nucleotidyltransferase